MKTQDGEPYSAAEYEPAVAPSGALSWAGGFGHFVSPLRPPAPASFGNGVTCAPRVDSGLSGVDAIVRWGR